MGTLFDDETHTRIEERASKIKGRIRRDEFRDDAMMELWDRMTFSRGEINATIENVFRKYIDEQENPAAEEGD
jgi:hypothetical protein